MSGRKLFLFLVMLMIACILTSSSVHSIIQNETSNESLNTWYLQTSWDTSGLFDVFFSSQTSGWAVGVGTILHTTDAGNIWTEQYSPVAGNFYSVFFVNDNIGWAAATGGIILHTTNGGDTWVQQNSGYGGSYLFNLFFINETHGFAAGGKPQTFPTGPNRVILKTTDGGSTWTTNLFESDTSPFQSIYFVDANHGWAVGNYNFDSNQILYTSNGGVSWNAQISGVTTHLEDVHFVDHNNGFIVGQQATLLYTTNGGNTWLIDDPGISHSLSSIHFTDSLNGWICGGNNTDASILRTSDAGSTWNLVDPATDNFLYSIYLTDPTHGWAVGFNGDIVSTIQVSNTPPDKPMNPIPSNMVHGTNPDPVLSVEVTDPNSDPLTVRFYDASTDNLIGTDYVISNNNRAYIIWNYLAENTTYSWYAIADDGQDTNQSETWSFTTGDGIDTSPTSDWYEQTYADTSGLFDVFFTNTMKGWAAGVGTIIHTTDAGNNIWYEQDTPVATNYYSIFFINDYIGWVSGTGGIILHTTDGGNTWTQQTTGYGGSYVFNLFFINETHGFAAGGKPQTFPTGPNRVILKTTDGGTTWTTNYFASDTSPLNKIYFTDENTGWTVGDYDQYVGSILHTNNGGNSWNMQDAGVTTHLTDVHFTNATNGWITSLFGTLLHTTNGGTTWNIENPGTSHSLSSIHFTDTEHGWICGGNNTHATILKTNDSGTSWMLENPGTNEYLYSIYLSDKDHGWAVGFNGVITHMINNDGFIPIEDINQSIHDRGFPIRHAADGDWGAGQNFTPTLDYLTKCEIYLRKFGTPEFNLTVDLREDHPQGTLVDSIVFSPENVSSSWTWLTLNFDDIEVNASKDYFIVCPPAPSGVTTSFGYEWGYAFGNQYDFGSFWFTRDGGNLWRDLPTMYEMVFKTYGYDL